MDKPQTVTFRRRHLPHWMVADHSYFVTIRLKGSLPRAVAEELVREREALTARKCSDAEMEELRRAQFERIETTLDAARTGPKFLNIAPVADVVFRAFLWLEDSRGWLVRAATIMPNHLHILMRHPGGRNDQLNRDLGILKGFTAREANTYLDRVGKPFWMDENFDHWCRNDAKLHGAARYIAMNPVEAGLTERWQDWPWTRVSQAFLADLVPNAVVFGCSPLLGGKVFGDAPSEEWPSEYDSIQNRSKVREIRHAAGELGVSPSACVLKQIADQGIVPVTSTARVKRLQANMKLFTNLSHLP